MHEPKTGRFAASSFGALAVLAVLALSPLAAAAQKADAAPVVERGVYGAWSLACLKRPTAGAAACSLSQVVAADPQGAKVMLGVVIDQADATSRPVMHFRFSPGALREAGIGIKIDDADPMRLAISECDAKRCEASGHLTAEVAERMRQGKLAQLAYFTQERKQVTVPLSLAGLGEALAALEKTVAR